MNLILRMLRVLLAALLARRAAVMGEFCVPFRVWINDLDTNLHMNNGRYLTLMDLGRLDLMVRSGLLGPVLKNHWMPVLAAAQIRWRRSLAPFERYTLHSRILCWDTRYAYIAQTFQNKAGIICATALVKAAIRDRDGAVPLDRVLRAINITTPSPPMPQEVRAWIEAESALREAGAAPVTQ